MESAYNAPRTQPVASLGIGAGQQADVCPHGGCRSWSHGLLARLRFAAASAGQTEAAASRGLITDTQGLATLRQARPIQIDVVRLPLGNPA